MSEPGISNMEILPSIEVQRETLREVQSRHRGWLSDIGVMQVAIDAILVDGDFVAIDQDRTRLSLATVGRGEAKESTASLRIPGTVLDSSGTEIFRYVHLASIHQGEIWPYYGLKNAQAREVFVMLGELATEKRTRIPYLHTSLSFVLDTTPSRYAPKKSFT
ncbi:MAG TPA: hypothetical protein VL989_00055 [Candidatus Sulfotelmatobacter sp.]|nr:hypothetical protein [Candidatus Sulfotelmatobacter sp.]